MNPKPIDPWNDPDSPELRGFAEYHAAMVAWRASDRSKPKPEPENYGPRDAATRIHSLSMQKRFSAASDRGFVFAPSARFYIETSEERERRERREQIRTLKIAVKP